MKDRRKSKWYMRFIWLCLAVWLLPGSFIRAQQLQDTLGEVRVRAARKSPRSEDAKLRLFSPGQKSVTLDSIQLRLFQQQSLAQLLYQQAPVFIKSYGFNGLATLNFRGSSAAQSQVLWNGVPLQNAALGVADISLLPVSAVDKVHIVFGGSSALWGSGNVGGVLLLENDKPVYDSAGKYRMQLSAGAGSFGQGMARIRLGYSARKWQIGLNAFGQQAANDFRYAGPDGRQQKMSHSQLKGGGLILNAAYRPVKDHEFRFSGWQQKYDRQIPPALFESLSRKEQQDISSRFLLGWEYTLKNTVWYAKSAFIRDGMHYEDSAVRLVSDNHSYQYFQEAGMRKRIAGDGNLTVFVPFQYAWMEQPGGLRRSQRRLALASSLQKMLFGQRMSAAVNMRAESIGRQGILLPGMNLSWRLTQYFELRGNVQKAYRAPTLNEWYYQPGGNELLKPERGWAEELGYALNFRVSDKLRFSHDLAVFNRDIKDWILWFGGAIWTPHNIAVVRSQGVEASLRASRRTGKWSWHMQTNASYTSARTRSSYMVNDGSAGMQIPYTPLWQWQANLGAAIGRFYANYNHTYSGYRFITTDESQRLPAFHTGNAQLMYTTIMRSRNLQLTLQCNNIAGQSYVVVAGRPLPGRNWLAGITFALD